MSREGATLVGLVLAAGASRRMGPGRNKLLEIVGGRPLVAAPVAALQEAGIPRIVVVLGHDAGRVREALAGAQVEFVENTEWASGMGRSLAVGIEAIAGGSGGAASAVFVSVGDLPGLRAVHVEQVVDAWRADPAPERICVPAHDGRDGHPVLFGPAHLPALAALEGDRGARAILDAHSEAIVRVEVASDGILADVDTPDALARARDR